MFTQIISLLAVATVASAEESSTVVSATQFVRITKTLNALTREATGIAFRAPQNATVPNATLPNATVPNATVPNATVSNATVPNATTPNATTPNTTAPVDPQSNATAPQHNSTVVPAPGNTTTPDPTPLTNGSSPSNSSDPDPASSSSASSSIGPANGALNYVPGTAFVGAAIGGAAALLL